MAGSIYYRLLQVHPDGTQTYSAIEQVVIKATNQVAVYPNPAKNVIQLSGISQPVASVQLSDLQGRIQRLWNGVNQDNPLEVGDLASGIYLLRLIDTNFTKTIKIMID